MGNIKRAFVIGWPINHSMSPHLHQFWLDHYNISGSYEKIAVTPDDLSAFLHEMKNNQFVGGNVTIPHKESVYEAIASHDPSLQELGAVNTLWFEGEQLKASNSDGYGFSANLDDFCKTWRTSNSAVILGAGGAAKAIAFELKKAGIHQITLVNRTLEKAEHLATKLGSSCNFAGFENIDDILGTADILINTTSLGMKGQPELRLNLESMNSGSIVTDIVYNPLDTPLLQQARSRDLFAIDGIGMLLHQAVPGFEKWFGQRPQVTPKLRAHILDIMKTDGL